MKEIKEGEKREVVGRMDRGGEEKREGEEGVEGGEKKKWW